MQHEYFQAQKRRQLEVSLYQQQPRHMPKSVTASHRLTPVYGCSCYLPFHVYPCTAEAEQQDILFNEGMASHVACKYENQQSNICHQSPRQHAGRLTGCSARGDGHDCMVLSCSGKLNFSTADRVLCIRSSQEPKSPAARRAGQKQMPPSAATAARA